MLLVYDGFSLQIVALNVRIAISISVQSQLIALGSFRNGLGRVSSLALQLRVRQVV